MTRSSIVMCAALLLPSAGFAGDFNGDGFDDLAIGVPFEDVGSEADAGAVNVLYGSASFLSVAGDQFLTLAGLGLEVLGTEEFGSALATGDFNGDGFDDLAIGCPGATVAGLLAAGRVVVIHGGPAGLDGNAVSSFHQNTPGVKDAVEVSPLDPARSDERFGTTLCVGDFDGNGCDDLVIGVREGFGSGAKYKRNAGAVHVLRGTPTGLVVKGNQQFHLDAKGIPGVADPFANFGSALAAGDVDGDGYDDLAVGAADQVGLFAEGSVTLLRGRKKKGLTPKGAQRVTELDCATDVYPFTFFAGELALGDLNGDGRADLAIGARGANVGITPAAGAIYLLMGTPKGVVPNECLRITAGTIALPIAVDGARDVGAVLTFGDFNGDGNDDLAIGATLATVNGSLFAGRVHLVLGAEFAGPTAAATPTFEQGLLGMPDSAEAGDQFGSSLAAGDFDGDGKSDLAIGAPFEGQAVGGVGTIVTLRGHTSGLTTVNAALWTQDTAGVLDTAEEGDAFGFALGS
ncbi:MAG: FG-GAP repeat protein [Planctomycetes bacterium]|nr:FG-GAP repeat protein [Planctomycetota bacterium]